MAVQTGAPGEVLDIPEGACGGDPRGAGTGQAIDHPEPEPKGGRVALQRAVPVTDTDIDRPHLDPVAPGVLHELGGGIEAHGLAVENGAGVDRGPEIPPPEPSRWDRVHLGLHGRLRLTTANHGCRSRGKPAGR